MDYYTPLTILVTTWYFVKENLKAVGKILPQNHRSLNIVCVLPVKYSPDAHINSRSFAADGGD